MRLSAGFELVVSPLTGKLIRVLKSSKPVSLPQPEPINKHRGRYARIKKRRIERQLKASGSHTEEQWVELRASYGACLCCGATERLVRDHVIALYRGGSDGIENIQPLCYKCNLLKGTKTIDYRPFAI